MCTIEFRDFSPDVILSVQKRAVRRDYAHWHFTLQGLGPAYFDRSLDAVSLSFSPSASDYFDLLPVTFQLISCIVVLTINVSGT